MSKREKRDVVENVHFPLVMRGQPLTFAISLTLNSYLSSFIHFSSRIKFSVASNTSKPVRRTVMGVRSQHLTIQKSYIKSDMFIAVLFHSVDFRLLLPCSRSP